MPEEVTIQRAASALRTALGGKAMTRFDSPRLVGPVPQAGRTVEHVESHGRHLEIEWDNGMILHTHLRRGGSWHVYRQGENWRRPYDQMRVSIENDNWVAVCFNAHDVETYRRPDKRRHPGSGRLGPDLTASDADLGLVVNLLLSYEDATARVSEVLLDQRVMVGIGNVYRCEVLWVTGLSPFAPVGELTEPDAVRIVNTAASLVRAQLHRGGAGSHEGRRLAVYGRNGQKCPRCPGSIDGARTGQPRRMLYWCPSCQSHLDPRVLADPDDTPVMDPHPAAQRFLADLPWNRHPA
ncbi:MAG: DNA-formamidopyrimidine glycosylase family protein [Ilumatobacter sp.]|uniref:DNA-formamidopyrimidine glycosylase family protein n=1 Tax=Ilumatobacter sp. TaxID=1967498 RepID=UPI003299D18E